MDIKKQLKGSVADGNKIMEMEGDDDEEDDDDNEEWYSTTMVTDEPLKPSATVVVNFSKDDGMVRKDKAKGDGVKKEAKSPSQKEEIQTLKTASRLHLFFSLWHGMYVCRKMGNSVLLQGLILSAVPRSYLEDLSSNLVNKDNLLHILHWFRDCWKRDGEAGEMNLYSLWRCILSKTFPSDEFLVSLCYCLFLALGYTCRLVYAIEPFQKKLKTGGGKGRSSSGVSSPTCRNPAKQWIELWFEDKWMNLDCINAVVDDPFAMEKNEMIYALAFESLLLRDAFHSRGWRIYQRVKLDDVTFRYASKFHETVRKMRNSLDDKAMSELLSHLSMESKLQSRIQEECDSRERKEAFEKEPLPTSISAFNNHPKYVLERHLKQFEVLRDKTVILGYCREEAVYPRSAVGHVKARENWIKLARSIKSGEEPAKFIKKRKKPKPKSEFSSSKRVVELSSDDEEEEEEDDNETVAYNPRKHTALYGEWQTVTLILAEFPAHLSN